MEYTEIRIIILWNQEVELSYTGRGVGKADSDKGHELLMCKFQVKLKNKSAIFHTMILSTYHFLRHCRRAWLASRGKKKKQEVCDSIFLVQQILGKRIQISWVSSHTQSWSSWKRMPFNKMCSSGKVPSYSLWFHGELGEYFEVLFPMNRESKDW